MLHLGGRIAFRMDVGDFLEHIVVESVLSGFSEACGDCLYLMVALVIVPEYRNLSESNL